MSLLRAATTTRIDEEVGNIKQRKLKPLHHHSTIHIPRQASPTNVTAIHGEMAMLVCRVINIGDKSVGFLQLIVFRCVRIYYPENYLQ
jgi:hypothetical protein